MGSWNTRPRKGARLYSHRPEISTPSIKIAPESTGHTPDTALSMVDLPAPFPPITVQKSPVCKVRFRFCKAFFSLMVPALKVLYTFLISNMIQPS